MRYQITYSDRFKKSYKKLTVREQKLVQDKVMILSENPMHPSLRVKRIKGTADLYNPTFFAKKSSFLQQKSSIFARFSVLFNAIPCFFVHG